MHTIDAAAARPTTAAHIATPKLLNPAICKAAAFIAVLSLTSGAPVQAARPTPPPPDPCVTPNPVTEATFPAFVFTQTIQITKNTYDTGTFLTDLTGKCTRKVANVGLSDGGEFRYNTAANLAMIVGNTGPSGGVVVGMSSISFGPGGLVVTSAGEPTTILHNADLTLPADIAAAGWQGTGAMDPRVSPDGGQLLFSMGYHDIDWIQYVSSYWTCSVSYDPSSHMQPVEPSTCREVYRDPIVNANWGGEPVWGMVPGTIYATKQTSASNTKVNSLYRLTLQPAPAPALVEEIFNNGVALGRVRVSVAPTGPDVLNGELVAVLERHSPARCTSVWVIDAYRCTGLNCPIVNQKGMRSVTWLPDVVLGVGRRRR